VGIYGKRDKVKKVAAFSFLIFLASCSVNSGDTWTISKQESAQRQICPIFQIEEDSGSCQCVLNAVMSNYPSPSDFENSLNPSTGFVNDLNQCGFQYNG
jgi:hypothetical protein